MTRHSHLHWKELFWYNKSALCLEFFWENLMALNCSFNWKKLKVGIYQLAHLYHQEITNAPIKREAETFL